MLTAPAPYPPTRWTRSQNGLIAGVCDGIARQLGVEAWLVRFFWVMTILFFGTGLLAYIVLALCLPREDRVSEAYKPMLLGVCSRISRRTEIEVGLVRAGTVLIGCFTLGVVVVAYIVLYFVMPDPDTADHRTI